jgi:hypothetical protein
MAALAPFPKGCSRTIFVWEVFGKMKDSSNAMAALTPFPKGCYRTIFV